MKQVNKVIIMTVLLIFADQEVCPRVSDTPQSPKKIELESDTSIGPVNSALVVAPSLPIEEPIGPMDSAEQLGKDVPKLMLDLSKNKMAYMPGSSPDIDLDAGSNLNLSGLDLTGADLSGLNFSRCIFTKTKLPQVRMPKGRMVNNSIPTNCQFRNTNLTNANLSNTNLSGADLSGANLTNANLTNANLRYANLTAADLAHANLTKADLLFTNLEDANLTRANLSNSKGFNTTKVNRYTNLKKAKGLNPAEKAYARKREALNVPN